MNHSNQKFSEGKSHRQDKVLVCGIDLGQKEDAFEIADPTNGLISNGKMDHSYNSICDFISELEDYRDEHGYKDITFAMEGTGHMWIQMASFLQRKGHKARLVRNDAVKNKRKLSGHHRHRSDSRAAHHITDLALDGNLLDRRLETQEPWISLRGCAREYQLIIDSITKEKQRIRDFLRNIYPGYEEIFSDPFRLTSMAVLLVLPRVYDLDEDEFIGQVRSHFRGKRLPVGKCREIWRYIHADPPWGYVEGRRAYSQRIGSAARRLTFFKKQKDDLRARLLEAYEQTGYRQNIDSITASRSVQNAIVLGFIGDPSDYHSSGALVRLAGLDIGENSSGTYQGDTQITKCGRGRLRRAVVGSVRRIVNSWQNAAFSEKYYQLMEEKGFAKYQAYCACGAKYLRTVWWLSVHNDTYDPLVARNGLSAADRNLEEEKERSKEVEFNVPL